VDQKRLAPKEPERLRGARTEPNAETGSRNEDRDVTTHFLLRGHVAVLVKTCQNMRLQQLTS
jgi:hypothetical protein